MNSAYTSLAVELLPHYPADRVQSCAEFAVSYSESRPLDTDDLVNDFINSVEDKHRDEMEFCLDNNLQSSIYTDGHLVRSFLADTALLLSLSVPTSEMRKRCAEGSFHADFRPIGCLYKIGFRTIRTFLHPNSDQSSFRELYGRYLVASIFMEVATSVILRHINLPRASRVFCGLGGALLLIPPTWKENLIHAIKNFNTTYSTKTMGFEVGLVEDDVSLSDTHNQLIATVSSDFYQRQTHSGSNKLRGWEEPIWQTVQEDIDFIRSYAVAVSQSSEMHWSQKNVHVSAHSGLKALVALLPYWVYPATSSSRRSNIPTNTYIATPMSNSSCFEESLRTVASTLAPEPLIYCRLDISGLRIALAKEAALGIKPMYRFCHRMALFFKEEIPAICQDINYEAELGLEVLLLHSSCDDATLVVPGLLLDTVFQRITNKLSDADPKVVFGTSRIRLGMSPAGLSREAMADLIKKKPVAT